MSKAANLTVNAVWSKYAQGLSNSRFIATDIFPIIPVAEEDKAGKIPLVSNEAFEPSQSKRAPHGKTPIVNGNPITGFATYAAELDTLAYGIDITERKGKVLDLYKHGTNVVSNKVMLNREMRTAALVRNNALYTSGNTSSPTNKWTNTVTSDPIADFETAFGVIETNVGDAALKIAFGGKSWRAFKKHPIVHAMLSGNSTKVITPEIAADILEVDQVIVGKSVYIDPITGARTDIWGDDVIIFGNHPPAGTQTLYSHAFGWTAAVEGFDKGPAINTFTSEDELVEYVRAFIWEDSIFHGQIMGYLLRDTNA